MAFTVILKTQSKQKMSPPTYGIEGFSTLEFLIQLYEPIASNLAIFPDYTY